MGFHFFVITDDVPEERCFRILNSYGPNWGLDGTALMPYEYFPQFPLTKIVSFTPFEEVKDLIVKEQLIFRNRSHEPLTPQGVVIHSTATPGATAQDEYVYFNTGDRQASAHYFVDGAEIIRCVPESEVAWHAGKTANRKYLSVEMCEPSGNPGQFTEVWNKTVWLVADACKRYGWNTKANVFSHRGISAMYGETDHTDPIGYLAQYGKTWEQLLAAIDQEIEGGTKVFENLVVYGGFDDGAAKLLADKLKAPVVHVDNVTDDLWACAKNKYKVGGGAFRDAQVVSGADRFATMQAVLNL